jgi:hypothetical protein
MRGFKRVLLIFWGLGFLMTTYGAMTIDVEPKKAQVGQTVRVVLNLGAKNLSLPPLKAWQKDFKVVGTEHSINQFMNQGQFQASYMWVVYIIPRHQGILTLPSIKIGDEKTSPIQIEVTDVLPQQNLSNAQSSVASAQEDPILMKADIHPKDDVYVNQQILYTVKLYTHAQIIDSEYLAPAVEHALILPLGNTLTTQEQIKDQTYQVSTQKYLIFPQKNGDLVIDPPAFTAIVFDVPPRRMRVSAPKVTLPIKPIPEGHRVWLPALDLTLEVQDEPPNNQYHIGDTLTRVITLKAKGVPAQLLPRLEFEKPEQAAVYPEKPIDDNKIINEDWVGEVQYKVNYVIQQTGKLVIPELKLKWFNTEKHQDAYAVIPQKTYQVEPSPKAQSKIIKPLPDQKAMSALRQNNTKTLKASPSVNGIVLAFVVALVALIFASKRIWFQHIEKNFAKKRLREACFSNDPSSMNAALIHWINLIYPSLGILNLQQLVVLIDNASLKTHLLELQLSLYGPSGQGQCQGRALYKGLKKLKIKAQGQGKKNQTLPPLNPD